MTENQKKDRKKVEKLLKTKLRGQKVKKWIKKSFLFLIDF